ncbi:SANT/Myb domain [Sesbania bispinosa]|nr:SANT/Myb domain [Sesbania bispinosa]
MDGDVGRWALEFLLGKPFRVTDSNLIKRMICSIPLSDNDSFLKKSILLKTLEDELSTVSIQESMLEILEILEEVLRCDGSPITAAMRAAYCGVAVECTLKYLELELSHPAYIDAVQRIWSDRICYMEPSRSSEGSLLFSAELNRWRIEIEASLSDSRVMDRLAAIPNTRRDAIKKIKAYLAEAWANIGPSFLDLASVSLPTNQGLRRLLPNSVATSNNVPTAEEFSVSDLPVSPIEIWKDNQLLKDKNYTTTGIEEMDPSTTCSKIDSLPSHEVQQVGESLECNSMALHTLTKDSLPNSLHMTDVVRSELTVKEINQDPPVEENKSSDADVTDPHACQGINNNEANLNKTTSVHHSDVQHPSLMEPNSTARTHESINNNETNLNKTTSVRQSDVQRPSLMEPNSTARTHEWDDSIDGLQGETSNDARRFHLPSPKREKLSPLKKYEPTNITKRRKVKKWSELEEETLRTAVNKFGKGNWKWILNSYREIFENRTDVDLKDKWRNMSRNLGFQRIDDFLLLLGLSMVYFG